MSLFKINKFDLDVGRIMVLVVLDLVIRTMSVSYVYCIANVSKYMEDQDKVKICKFDLELGQRTSTIGKFLP